MICLEDPFSSPAVPTQRFMGGLFPAGEVVVRLCSTDYEARILVTSVDSVISLATQTKTRDLNK